MNGGKDLYQPAFLHVGTRIAYIAPSTFHPNHAWVTERAEAFLKRADEGGLGVNNG